MSHALANARSLALHRAVAGRLAQDESLLERARTRVQQWDRGGAVHPEHVTAWSEILAGSLATVCAFIVRDDERSRMLRQSSPFAFVLSPRERWQVWRSVGRR